VTWQVYVCEKDMYWGNRAIHFLFVDTLGKWRVTGITLMNRKQADEMEICDS